MLPFAGGKDWLVKSNNSALAMAFPVLSKPLVTSTFPSVCKVALCHSRAVAKLPAVAEKRPVAGSYSSASESTLKVVPVPCTPPVRSTFSAAEKRRRMRNARRYHASRHCEGSAGGIEQFCCGAAAPTGAEHLARVEQRRREACPRDCHAAGRGGEGSGGGIVKLGSRQRVPRRVQPSGDEHFPIVEQRRRKVGAASSYTASRGKTSGGRIISFGGCEGVARTNRAAFLVYVARDSQ
jgi:hypothetical protein